MQFRKYTEEKLRRISGLNDIVRPRYFRGLNPSPSEVRPVASSLEIVELGQDGVCQLNRSPF